MLEANFKPKSIIDIIAHGRSLQFENEKNYYINDVHEYPYYRIWLQPSLSNNFYLRRNHESFTVNFDISARPHCVKLDGLFTSTKHNAKANVIVHCYPNNLRVWVRDGLRKRTVPNTALTDIGCLLIKKVILCIQVLSCNDVILNLKITGPQLINEKSFFVMYIVSKRLFSYQKYMSAVET